MKPSRIAAAALLLLPGAWLLPAPPEARAFRDRLADRSLEDLQVGYAIKPVMGWEPTPRKNPDDPFARSLVGGWYGKNDAGNRPTCAVYAFGSYFPEEADRRVATEADPAPAPPGPGDADPSDPAPDGPPGGDGGTPPAGDGGTTPGDPPSEPPAGGTGGDPAGGEGGSGEGGAPDGKDGGTGGGKEGPKEEEEKKPPPRTLEEKFGKGPQSFEEILDGFRKSKDWRLDLKTLETRFGSERDEGILYEGTLKPSALRGPAPSGFYHVVAASVRRGDFEVAVLYTVLDHKYYVRDYRGTLVASAKSLEILPEREMRRAREEMEKKLAEAGGENAAWVEKVLAGLPPGWTNHRTDHYVIVYDRSIDAPPPTGAPGLIPRIGRQLEALRRDIYEPLFPADEPVTAISIVKVTQDRNQYLSYGAPQGSAGYWSWPSRELVFYYEQGKALDVTLPVLNHEAFHQYIFYAVGQVSPHSWFNEGHGDYFAGFTLNRGKFREAKFEWRRARIRAAIESGDYVPLKNFLGYSQAEYYGAGKGKSKSEGKDVGQNYAQGWSLIWFLRTTKDEKYKGVLDRYFNTLKTAVSDWKREEAAAAEKEGRPPLATWNFPEERNKQAMEDALEAAFRGIDIDQMEKDWLASKPY